MQAALVSGEAGDIRDIADLNLSNKVRIEPMHMAWTVCSRKVGSHFLRAGLGRCDYVDRSDSVFGKSKSRIQPT